MPETWPVGVPQTALVAGYEETDQDNVASYDVEVGRPLRRRRASQDMEEVKFSTDMTFTQYDTLKTWRRDTLKSGVLPFTRNHPRKGTSCTALFLELSSPETINGTMCRATMRMLLTVE
jgi:hypothetical protein